MDTKIIQKRIDDLSAAMVAKGCSEPEANFRAASNATPTLYLKWKDAAREGQILDDNYKSFKGSDLATIFDEASAFVVNMPDAEQMHLNEFMACLARAIDYGKKHNLETEFLNPLVATMKTLSENVISDQRAA